MTVAMQYAVHQEDDNNNAVTLADQERTERQTREGVQTRDRFEGLKKWPYLGILTPTVINATFKACHLFPCFRRRLEHRSSDPLLQKAPSTFHVHS